MWDCPITMTLHNTLDSVPVNDKELIAKWNTAHLVFVGSLGYSQSSFLFIKMIHST